MISEVVHVYALRITLRAIVAARISEIADKLFFLRVYDVARCEGCTHTVIGYNSCRNRHCPKCHVWTAPAVQEESDVSANGRVQSCIRPIVAAILAAGHDVIRGLGPNQGSAL